MNVRKMETDFKYLEKKTTKGNKSRWKVGVGESRSTECSLTLFLRKSTQDLKYGIRYFVTASYIRYLCINRALISSSVLLATQGNVFFSNNSM
jgi:hypothetical protein